MLLRKSIMSIHVPTLTYWHASIQLPMWCETIWNEFNQIKVKVIDIKWTFINWKSCITMSNCGKLFINLGAQIKTVGGHWEAIKGWESRWKENNKMRYSKEYIVQGLYRTEKGVCFFFSWMQWYGKINLSDKEFLLKTQLALDFYPVVKPPVGFTGSAHEQNKYTKYKWMCPKKCWHFLQLLINKLNSFFYFLMGGCMCL